MFFPWKQTAQAIETETPPLKQSQIAQDVSGRGKQSPCRRLSVRPSVRPASRPHVPPAGRPRRARRHSVRQKNHPRGLPGPTGLDRHPQQRACFWSCESA